MQQKTRRSFLAAMGVTAFAGCASQAGSDETTDPGDTTTTAGDGTTEPSTTTGMREDTTERTTAKTTTTGSGSPSEVVADFEDLDRWEVETGTLEPLKEDTYAGSQAASLKAESGNENQAHIKTFPAAQGENNDPLSLEGKNVSIAFKSLSHSFTKLDVRLYAPGPGQVIRLPRTLVGPKDRWVRLNLGAAGDIDVDAVDLSQVYEIHIIARPRDPNSGTPIHALVDDFRMVDAPEKGQVMFTFDDSVDSHYTNAYERMKQHGFPGVEAVITEAIGDDGYLTMNQMRTMQESGWDMISHPNTGATPLPERPKREQASLMKSSQNWLERYGFSGYRYMGVPKNTVGSNTFDLAQEHYDLTMSFGAGLNALPLVTKDTLLSRFYADDPALTKRMVDYAARFNQLAIPLFHDIGTEDGISTAEFEDILQYVKQKVENGEIEIVTPSMLEEKGMLIQR